MTTPSTPVVKSVPMQTALRELRKLIFRSKPGERLPTLRQLVETLALSEWNVRQALKVVEAEGLVELHRGCGTFVARLPNMHFPILITEEWQRMFGDFQGRLAAYLDQVGATCELIKLSRNAQIDFDKLPLGEDTILAAGWEKEEELKELIKRVGRVVVFNREPRSLEVDSVAQAWVADGYVATTWLLSQGHTKIAFIGGLRTVAQVYRPADATLERHCGYMEALWEKGIDPDPRLTTYFGRHSQFEDFHETLKGVAELEPEVVIVESTSVAEALNRGDRSLPPPFSGPKAARILILNATVTQGPFETWATDFGLMGELVASRLVRLRWDTGLPRYRQRVKPVFRPGLTTLEQLWQQQQATAQI
ncbi:MAG TPA: GntR family transcriptional regulator [Planctomycetota bacterium]|nr:GntR family transcriptional regulator [Planctomycetota bacterium]